MYDVIVIGAGPAGSTAAKTLADRGFRVLLAERFRLPRYKSCSGQLIKKSLELTEKYFGEAVPQSVTCAPALNKGMVFTNDKGREYRFEQNGSNVWRSSFDYFLAQKAAAGGAELRDNFAALSCESGSGYVDVKFSGGNTEQARWIIDCEGAVGVVKRRLTGEKPQYITTFQTFNNGSINLDHHYFYAYLQPELSEYDAWFNVKDGQLVLGVSVKNRDISRYYEQFIGYMKREHDLRIERQTKAEKWIMPRISRECCIDYGVGRVLFAGEAAGFLNPMGEGISAGLESGYCAACAVAAHFDDTAAVYSDYKASVEDLHAYMRRQWSFVGGIADTFGDMRL